MQPCYRFSIDFPFKPIPAFKLFEKHFDQCHAISTGSKRRNKMSVYTAVASWDLGAVSESGPIRDGDLDALSISCSFKLQKTVRKQRAQTLLKDGPAHADSKALPLPDAATS
eukprot:3544710-Karenia_brevis.AAC.1